MTTESQNMPHKDPASYSWITYVLVSALSAWGGIVGWLRKRNEGATRPFNFMELVGEVLTSAFAGILTFWLCEASDINPLVTAALVGISGHMGSRAIYHMETWAEARFPRKQ
jgi:hypothetical protein